MDNTPADGNACKGDNTPVKVCGAFGMLSDSIYPTGVKVIGAWKKKKNINYIYINI